LRSLESIILGGERLLTADCKAWLSHYPEHVLYNEYGPTETTVAVTQQKISQENIHEFPIHAPIGQAGTNMSCYLLDEELRPVQDGERAELYIGGSCLARGYANQPLLTEKKFIPSPFIDQKGERLYKTGDLCALLPNGSIEFFGRIDTQIKLRGYSI
jgi:non-ribosomal peptide synthetase component F